MTDLDLIYNIKKDRDVNGSLTELIQRHSGIYVNIVNSYVPENSLFVKKADILEEKDYHIYQAALKYEDNHGTKFSTYLGNETKWLCLNTFNRAKRRPQLTSEEYIQEESFFQEPDTGEQKELISKIFELTHSNPDPRVEKIFKMRYSDAITNKLTPWQKISTKLGLSIQGCINIHNKAIRVIKSQLNQENA